MAKELKIWLDDKQPIIAKLTSLGAQYIGKTTSVHTYFNQPEGRVLKLVEMKQATTLDTLKREGRQFVIIEQQPVTNPDALAQQLTDQYGIKTRLVMHAESYRLHEYEVSFYHIEDIGKFLILAGDNPSVELLSKWFGIASPKVVTASFDNL